MRIRSLRSCSSLLGGSNRKVWGLLASQSTWIGKFQAQRETLSQTSKVEGDREDT